MNNALLVIDVQQSFRQRADWELISNPSVVQRCAALVERARDAGDPVYWILHSEPGSDGPFDPKNGLVRLQDGLVARVEDIVISKTSFNAFTSTNLARSLTQRAIGSLTVCGIRTEQCCETTTRVGADLGYRMTFVTEATATHPIRHRESAARTNAEIMADPRTLHTDAIVERTEFALAKRFARIADIVDLD